MAKLITENGQEIFDLLKSEISGGLEYTDEDALYELGMKREDFNVPLASLKIDWDDQDESGQGSYDPFNFPEWIDVLPTGFHLSEDKKQVALVCAIAERGGRIWTYWLGNVIS